MTKAQAESATSQIIAAGYNTSGTQNPDGSWTVKAFALSPTIPVSDAQALATSLGVSAMMAEVVFK